MLVIQMLFTILGSLIPFAVWFFVILIIIKKAKGANNANDNGSYENQQYPMNGYNGQGNMNSNKYNTINSHYSQQTLNGNGSGTFIPNNGGHTHAYEHKVQPIEEASVMERFEDRKEAYIERKQQMKADLPKTSYSKMEEINNGYVNNGYVNNGYNTNGYNNYGQNGDMASVSNRNEELVICKYCGANNIVPISRTKAYNCYFCRENIK